MRKSVGMILLLAFVLLTACKGGVASTKIGDLEILSPWARAAAGMTEMEGGGGNGGAFMLLKNSGSAPDQLVRAESTVAKSVELHKSSMEGDMMTMSPVDSIEIPAGGEVELKPGSYHIMLIDLQQDLKPGEKFTLTLVFEKAGKVDVEVEIREP
jgi:periplasmic copper chaperone A